jgi:hypothetical protein
MKLNGILLFDQEIKEHFGAVYESEIFYHNGLPPNAGGIRIKLNKPIRKTETPDWVSGGKKLYCIRGILQGLVFLRICWWALYNEINYK